MLPVKTFVREENNFHLWIKGWEKKKKKKKIDSSMLCNSLFNNSENFKIDTELSFYCISVMALVLETAALFLLTVTHAYKTLKQVSNIA